jgi:hypothetical protein
LLTIEIIKTILKSIFIRFGPLVKKWLASPLELCMPFISSNKFAKRKPKFIGNYGRISHCMGGI